MNNNPNQPAFYFLQHDYRRLNPDLGGSEVDLVHPKELTAIRTTVDGPEKATLELSYWLMGSDPFDVEEPIQFTGFFPTILRTDAPIAEQNYPLYSKKLLDILKTVGQFEGRVFQTQIEDDVVGSGDDPNYPVGQITEEFVLLQLPHLDILDIEKSTYSDYYPRSRRVTGLQEAVLNIPDGGLPPIFRLKASPVHILVSTSAKEALEAVGIHGVEFTRGPYV